MLGVFGKALFIELPCVELLKYKFLPATSGVYFVVDKFDKCLYIGEASNLKVRWDSHNQWKNLSPFEDKRIFYLEIHEEYRKSVEEFFISLVKPKLNIKRNARLILAGFKPVISDEIKPFYRPVYNTQQKAEVTVNTRVQVSTSKSDSMKEYVLLSQINALFKQLYKLAENLKENESFTLASQLVNRSRVVCQFYKDKPALLESILEDLCTAKILVEHGRTASMNVKYRFVLNRTIRKSKLEAFKGRLIYKIID